ncbi:MAG TPA: hypothetical protein PLY93_09885, partial [Turneriella sp.]|nr:hypothetical protein [Turneriella sp.]
YRIDFWRQAYMSFAMPHPISVETLPALKAQVDITLQKPIYILSLGEFTQSELTILKESGKICAIEHRFEPSWQEKLVIYANPKFNARRDTTVLYYCSPSLARASK